MKKHIFLAAALCIIFSAGCSAYKGGGNNAGAPEAQSANQESVSQDSASQDSANQESAGKESASQESVSQGQNDGAYALGDQNSAPIDGGIASEAEAPAYYGDIDETRKESANTEEYLAISENAQVNTEGNSMLTFSLKVDTASYRNAIRYINNGGLPPKDAVRPEEFINYFKYDALMPEYKGPFSIYAEIGKSIFDAGKYLAFVRVKSKDVTRGELPPSNLTFLIDTSGSMSSYERLPLVKSALGMLVETLTENDTVSIVTYAGDAGVALDSANGSRKIDIMRVIDNLESGGSTAGGQGILTAYALAEKNFRPNGNNRVILATDGDFNVGVSSTGELENLISTKRGLGVYLSILGVGMGNLKDSYMETLAKNGNGNYSYIDNVSEAKKVLVDESAANLYTIADDVKAQVEFNPALVSSYRLVGYENRALSNRDFVDDTKDAGEIGAGTDIVLMFELTLADGAHGSKYQAEPLPEAPYADELFEVRIRYKDLGEPESKLITVPVKRGNILDFNTTDYNFASAVAGFAHLLRNSEYIGNVDANQVIALAEENLGEDENGYRGEFVGVVKKYRGIS